jgi:hypothetical protein
MMLMLGMVIMLGENDCDTSQQKSSQPLVIQKKSHPINRFMKADSSEGDVALDTKTGQLCRTWEWQSKNRTEVNARENLPLCLSLYNNDPD